MSDRSSKASHQQTVGLVRFMLVLCQIFHGKSSDLDDAHVVVSSMPSVGGGNKPTMGDERSRTLLSRRVFFLWYTRTICASCSNCAAGKVVRGRINFLRHKKRHTQPLHALLLFSDCLLASFHHEESEQKRSTKQVPCFVTLVATGSYNVTFSDTSEYSLWRTTLRQQHYRKTPLSEVEEEDNPLTAHPILNATSIVVFDSLFHLLWEFGLPFQHDKAYWQLFPFQRTTTTAFIKYSYQRYPCQLTQSSFLDSRVSSISYQQQQQ